MNARSGEVSPYMRQHLVDPQRCIRCNACERVCDSGAISHAQNVVVDPARCTACLACLAGCPTGAIDNWRIVERQHCYGVAQQHRWSSLPAALPYPAALVDPGWSVTGARQAPPPASAAVPVLGRYPPAQPLQARLLQNLRLTPPDSGVDIHHLLLDLGGADFPVLEGQTVGVLPPRGEGEGPQPSIRLYSVASPRGGEAGRAGTLSLLVKRIQADREGQPIVGRASSYLCNLPPGAVLSLAGPYGASFLMPQEPQAPLLMIATGTGIAPLRAMVQQRLSSDSGGSAGILLFHGGTRASAMPFHDEMMALSPALLTYRPAYSRPLAGGRRLRVQHAVLQNCQAVMAMLLHPRCHLYLCGLAAMKQEVWAALERCCATAGADWPALAERMRGEGRLQVETY